VRPTRDADNPLDDGIAQRPPFMTWRSTQWGKLRLNITMSLDGFVAGPEQSETDPLGIGGVQLHQWLHPLKAFRETYGEEGGEVNASTPIAEEILGNVGATIMGRNMFGGGPGPWGDDPWKGYWGDNQPYHHPVFVLTRHPREPLEMEGGTTFHFVTEGIESALEQARAAAGERDVSIGGGANVVQQYLGAGCSMGFSSPWCRSSSAAARGCLTTSASRSRGFDKCRRSRRPESPTSGTSLRRDRASASWQGAEGDRNPQV
jgi:dihydrofolate reductase